MSDSEPIPNSAITHERLLLIPDHRKELYTRNDLPKADDILREAFQKTDLKKGAEPGEVERAKLDGRFIGLSDSEIDTKVQELVHTCLNEMDSYETISRERPEDRLRKLKNIAQNTSRIVVYSAPGDYYHLNKNDRYKDDPTMVAADRLRDDQAAILAIVISGIRQEWPDQDLLLFLGKNVLTNDDATLNTLQEKAKQAVSQSRIRIVYTGRKDEVAVVERIRRKSNLFIPGDCIDILPPEKVDNTVDQTKELGVYLKKNLADGDNFIVPMNLQGIRSMRMANQLNMTPAGVQAYVYAMPTMVGPEAIKYRAGEIKGTVFRTLTKEAAFDTALHTII